MRKTWNTRAGTGTYLMALAAFLGLLALGNTVSAGTIPIIFNPTGNDPANPASNITLQTIDELPGNALALGYYQGPSFNLPKAGQSFTLVYQAAVGGLIDPNNKTKYSYINNQLTVVASFQEKLVTDATSGTASFVPTGTGIAEIYYNPTSSYNDTAGTGFQAGTLVYRGTTVAGGSGSFTVSNTNPVALDQSGTNNYPAISTITGNGSTQVSFNTAYANPNFFVGGIPSTLPLLLSITTTTNALPFTHVNPAAMMWDNSPGATTASVGTVNGGANALGNGTAPNVIFEADASTSFSVVPEPTTLLSALCGCSAVGLIGFSRLRSRRQPV